MAPPKKVTPKQEVVWKILFTDAEAAEIQAVIDRAHAAGLTPSRSAWCVAALLAAARADAPKPPRKRAKS